MTPEQFQRVEALFLEAARLPEDRRNAFLDETCGDDDDLRAFVARMLESHHDDSTFLEPPALEEIDPRPSTHETADTKIEGYDIVRVIAQGGSATVYEAWQTHPRRKVALKIPRATTLTDSERIRFEREIRILATLRHPGIAQIFAAGSYGSPAVPYFAMEYIENARSILRFAAEENLDRMARIERTLDVCDAIAHGHTQSIVHRDLKPDNILVGPDHRAKVIDFGVAWKSHAETSRRRATLHGQLVGSFATMSPEQWAGRHDDVGPASDVYALGVVLYELLTGRAPIDLENCSLADAADRVAHVAPAATDLPRDLDAILARALEKSARRRYADAGALGDDLRRFVAGHPVRARPARAPRRVALVVRRYPARTLAALLGFVAVILPLLLARTEQARSSLHDQAELVTHLLQDALRMADPSHRTAGPRTRERAMLANAAREIDERFGDFPATESTLRRTLGETYATLGLYADAVRQLRRSIALHREHLAGEDPQNLAAMLHAAGSALAKLARFDEAEPLLAEAIELRREIGDDPSSLAQTLGSFAECRFDRGAYEESERLYRDAIALASPPSEDPKAHARMRSLQCGLANTLVRRGKIDEAEAIAEAILADREAETSGAANDLTTAALCHNLGAMRVERQDFRGAERMLSRALAILREVQEPDHPDLASTLNALAVAHLKLGQAELAEKELLESIAIRRDALGDEHPALAGSLINLAAILKARGALTEAEARLAEAIRIQETTLGGEHPDLAFAMLSLASAMAMRGEIRDAIEHTRRAVALRENTLGSDHLYVAIARNQLGEFLTRVREYDEAQTLLERSEAVFTETVGPNHWMTQVCSSNLGHVLAARGDARAAERRFRRALRVAQTQFGPEHPSTARCRFNLALALTDLERFDDAEHLLRSAIDSLRGAGLASRMDLSLATLRLGIVLHAKQHYDEAAALLEESIALVTELRSASHWLAAYANAFLGSCETHANPSDAGKRRTADAYERLCEILGAESRECREVRGLLAANVSPDAKAESEVEVAASEDR